MRYFFFLAIAAMYGLCAKVTIVTHSYNRPDFIPLQLNAFKKFLRGEWEFIVFIDMTDGDFIADSYDLDNRSYFSERKVLESVSDPALVRLMQKRPDDIQFFLNYFFFCTTEERAITTIDRRVITVKRPL